MEELKEALRVFNEYLPKGLIQSVVNKKGELIIKASGTQIILTKEGIIKEAFFDNGEYFFRILNFESESGNTYRVGDTLVKE